MEHDYFAFISYARFDDEHNDGFISRAKEQLENELRSQTGRVRRIFQDKSNISIGHEWDFAIKAALSSSKILIPFITPSFFSSTACRDEVSRFMSLMGKVDNQKIIIPIYLITCPADILDSDNMAKGIFKFQYHDWRAMVYKRGNVLEFKESIFMLGSMILKSCPEPVPVSGRQRAPQSKVSDCMKSTPAIKLPLPEEIKDTLSLYIPSMTKIENVVYGNLFNGPYEDAVVISSQEKFEKIVTVLTFDEKGGRLKNVYSNTWFDHLGVYFESFQGIEQEVLVIECVGGSGHYLNYEILGSIDNELKILLKRDTVFGGFLVIEQNRVLEFSGKQGIIFDWNGKFFLASQLLMEPIHPASVNDIIIEFSIENDGSVHCNSGDVIHMYVGQGLRIVRTNYGIVERLMYNCDGVIDFVKGGTVAAKKGKTHIKIVPGGYDWEKAFTLNIVVE